MKHNVLTSVAHNIADSLASGIGLMIGLYETDIYSEIAKSQDGVIEVNFIRGTITSGTARLLEAVKRYQHELPILCEKQGVSVNDFKRFIAHYSIVKAELFVVLDIEDINGRCSQCEYVGVPLTKIRTLDNQGRIRQKPRQKQ